jgi:hypothetical protein
MLMTMFETTTVGTFALSEYLRAELRRLDLLLHRQILRLRLGYQLSLDEFRGLYISDEQVDQLIDQATADDGTSTSIDDLTQQADALRISNAQLVSEPWQRVRAAFNLSPFEQDVLLLALAPQIDLKYATLYAYLNDDITRKWPTYDLALRTFSRNADERIQHRALLQSCAPLLHHGLIQPLPPAPGHPCWSATGFVIAPLLIHALLGLPADDPQLAPFVRPERSPDKTAIRHVVANFAKLPNGQTPLFVVCCGQPGVGREQAIGDACRGARLQLLRVDLEALLAKVEQMPLVTQKLLLSQRLSPTALYLTDADTLFNKDGSPLPEGVRFIRQLAEGHGPVFLACSPESRWRDLLRGQRHVFIPFEQPDYQQRRHLWQSHLEQAGQDVPEATISALADRFVLNQGQIQAAVQGAIDMRLLQHSSELSTSLAHTNTVMPLSFYELASAAQAQSDQSLDGLATRVVSIFDWGDLVLPPSTLRQVKEVTTAIKYRQMVYSQWGFEQRIAGGKGLKVLFAGPSGTGKTMTATVIARDLGLELYKIDLSAIVSKYIGETEKNLDRIFRAARHSNAILFFDEADALFGKRSQVKDAHDRYANIEVAYLLQKMEEHEGAVILASNLSKNIDDAFSRRLHYIVDFPLPDEAHRALLWHGMFPARAPLNDDVDIPFLAQQFPMAGGDIRNVALAAAFAAAQDETAIAMQHLIRAVAQQMHRQGKATSPSDFKHYYALIAHDC